MNRLEALKQYVREEPGDPFNRYALALEMQKTDPVTAFQLLEELVTDFPNYLPGYYPYAQQLVEQNLLARAEQIFKKGMEVARQQQDWKTHRELESALRDVEQG